MRSPRPNRIAELEAIRARLDELEAEKRKLTRRRLAVWRLCQRAGWDVPRARCAKASGVTPGAIGLALRKP